MTKPKIDCRRLLPLMHAVLFFTAANVFAANREILIPESVIRTLLELPADGEVYSRVLKRDVWPKEKSAYEKNETVEVSFGKGIRSREGDRRHEKMMSPGIVFRKGALQIQGGWRVKKEVKSHPDHFDGTFHGRLHLAISRGEIFVSLDDFDLKWRRSWLAKFAGALLPIDVVGALESTMEQRVEHELEASLRKAITQKLSAHVGAPLRYISARIVPEGLMVKIESPPDGRP